MKLLLKSIWVTTIASVIVAACFGLYAFDKHYKMQRMNIDQNIIGEHLTPLIMSEHKNVIRVLYDNVTCKEKIVCYGSGLVYVSDEHKHDQFKTHKLGFMLIFKNVQTIIHEEYAIEYNINN